MPLHSDLKLIHADIATSPSSQSSFSPQDFHRLIDMVAANKGADGLFQYFKTNRSGLLNVVGFLEKNPEGVGGMLDMGATPSGRAELMAKLHDQGSRDALDFMIHNRDQFKAMQEMISDNPHMLTNNINFVANHADDLSEMAKFAAAHPAEMAQMADNATKAGPNATLKDMLKGLHLFAAEHAVTFAKVGAFAMAHGHELRLPPEEHGNRLQQFGEFALNHKDQLLALGQLNVTTNLENGLGGIVAQKQHEAVIHLEAASRQDEVASPASRFAHLKSVAPDMYQTAMELQRQSLALAQGMTFEDGRFKSTPDGDKALKEWEDRLIKFDVALGEKYPEYKIRSLDGQTFQERSPPVMPPWDFLDQPKLRANVSAIATSGDTGKGAPKAEKANIVKPLLPSFPRSAM